MPQLVPYISNLILFVLLLLDLHALGFYLTRRLRSALYVWPGMGFFAALMMLLPLDSTSFILWFATSVMLLLGTIVGLPVVLLLRRLRSRAPVVAG